MTAAFSTSAVCTANEGELVITTAGSIRAYIDCKARGGKEEVGGREGDVW